MTPPIALTTDFGLHDHFVGVLHGVIAGIAPRTRVIDLCHAVPPQDIARGAYILAAAAPWLPSDTIHVAVVDPGVGSARRAVAVRAGGRHWVGPDNGLLGLALALLSAEGPALGRAEGETWHLAADARAVVLTERRWWLPHPSQTFHGRDIFAPVAAHLANGVAIAELGSPLDRLVLLPPRLPIADGAGWRGEVLYVDRFGNLVTNLRRRHCPSDDWWVTVAGGRIAGLSASYAAMQDLGAIHSSDGYLEIALRGGSAAAALGVGVGAPVAVSPPP